MHLNVDLPVTPICIEEQRLASPRPPSRFWLASLFTWFGHGPPQVKVVSRSLESSKRKNSNEPPEGGLFNFELSRGRLFREGAY